MKCAGVPWKKPKVGQEHSVFNGNPVLEAVRGQEVCPRGIGLGFFRDYFGYQLPALEPFPPHDGIS